MTLKELTSKCCSSSSNWAEVLVFDSEDEFEKFVDMENELGIQFVIKGESGMLPIKKEVLDAEVDLFCPTGKNTIAVCCIGLFDDLFEKDE